VYIHGRPTGHPIHDEFAKILNAKFLPVDFILPWHENPDSGKIKRYLSWFLCGLFFPERENYSVFFTESIREPVLVMKLLRLINSRQILVPLMDNETLFFYHHNRYSKIVKWMIRKYLQKSDAIICVGDFQTQLAVQIVGEADSGKIRTVNNWVSREKSHDFSEILPDLDSNRILFIGDVSADFRAWYKGVDLIIGAFSIAASKNRAIILEMVGINEEKYLEKYITNLPPETKNRIRVNNRQPVLPFLKTAALYLHCARGEAWGISIMEALVSGVPVICSDLTGAKEIVTKVSNDLIVPINPETIAEKIVWYFNLSADEKLKLSEKGRRVMEDYTEEKSLERFKNAYSSILNEFYG
jgi:glycosyltransferase involved in cell wall biosynthesis